MARQSLNYGTSDNDPSADKAREGVAKIEANFVELYGGVAHARFDLSSDSLTASWRDDGSGNLGWYVGAAGAADGSQVKAVTINKTTGAATFAAPVTVNNLRLGLFNGTGQIANLLDNATGRLIDLADFPNISTVDATARFFRGTDTDGFKYVTIFRGDGTGTVDHQLVTGAAGTLASFCRNGGGMTVGHASPTSATLDVQAGAAVRGAAGTARELRLLTGNTLRWNMRANASAEAGSDAGSNLEIVRYSDAGANLGAVLSISRSTGTGSFDGIWRSVADNTHALGTGSFRWSVVYAGTGAINTSDAREKTPVRPFNPAEIAAAKELIAEIGIFQWLGAIEAKGEDAARMHVGMTVQRAIEIMEGHGLDPWRYGFICRDEVTSKVKVTQTVMVQAVDEVAEPYTEIEIHDGVPVRVEKLRTIEVPRVNMVAVLDEAGAPVMVEGAQAEEGAEPNLVPLLHPVPVLEEREVETEVEQPDGDRLGFRTDQLILFMMRSLLET